MSLDQIKAELAKNHEETHRVLKTLREDLNSTMDLSIQNNNDLRWFKKSEAEATVAGMQVHGTLAASFQANKATVEFLRNGTVPAIVNAMTGTVGSDGGFTVAPQLDKRIQDMLVAISPIRGIARRVTVNGGGDLKIPIGRRGATSAWVAENDARPTTATPVLGLVTPPGGELMAYGEMSTWIISDSEFDIEEWLRQNILEEFGVKEGQAFISGDGNNKPFGFLAGPVPVTTVDATRAFGTLQYTPGGAASTLTSSDALIDLVYSLRAPYRAGARWVMNSNTAKIVRKLKDGQNNYLWAPTYIAGQPESLLGYPMTMAEEMPDIGANSFPVAFGNFDAGYVVVDRVGTTMLRDPYTKVGFIKVFVNRRVHGSVTDSNAIKLLKIATS